MFNTSENSIFSCYVGVEFVKQLYSVKQIKGNVV
jgi:hypothetical protein